MLALQRSLANLAKRGIGELTALVKTRLRRLSVRRRGVRIPKIWSAAA